jgi:hypothetical protein
VHPARLHGRRRLGQGRRLLPKHQQQGMGASADDDGRQEEAPQRLCAAASHRPLCARVRLSS